MGYKWCLGKIKFFVKNMVSLIFNHHWFLILQCTTLLDIDWLQSFILPWPKILLFKVFKRNHLFTVLQGSNERKKWEKYISYNNKTSPSFQIREKLVDTILWKGIAFTKNFSQIQFTTSPLTPLLLVSNCKHKCNLTRTMEGWRVVVV